ncbi:MAG: metallophosphoesterase [Treponemataceae bacterium]|nr:metallophosphoesterase [Treponemataceae bacterium]
MNSLCQLENGILASEQALRELDERTAARLLVLSDSHGSRETVRAILQQFSANCDALVFAGDGIGDMAACFGSGAQDAASSATLPPVIAFAKGNNDPAFYPMQNAMLRVPRRVLLKAAGRKLLIVHGDAQNVGFETRTLEEEARLEGAGCAIFGHTHVPYESMRALYLLNPGSCARPRQQSVRSFAILEIRGKSISSTFYRISGTSNAAATPYLLH